MPYNVFMAYMRAVVPKFVIGATVENAGVEPRPAFEKDVADLDRRLVDLLHPGRVVRRKPTGAPAAAERAVVQRHA